MRIGLYLIFSLVVILFGVEARAQVTPQVSQTPSDDDRVHRGDIIDVDLVGSIEYDWRGPLNLSGDLEGFEVADAIPALCRTTTEIAADIEKAFAKTLRDPKAIVRIVDRSGRALVTMSGAIRTPTRFRITREAHLRELIVRSGGFTDDTSGEISIFRPPDLSCSSVAAKDNEQRTFNIKVSDLLKGDKDADIAIRPGDIVEVVQAMRVYVIGAVNNPRPVYSRAELTISRAIATAGGLNKDAGAGKATITRREGSETNFIEADLAKIKRGESVDIVLKPFDIIDVAGKGGSKRKFPPITPNNGNTATRELPIRVID